MYRVLPLLLLCAGIVLSAPQQDSNITYVKRHAKLEESKLDLNSSEKETKIENISSSEKESRIENVPLTIPRTTDVTTISTTEDAENTKTTKTPDTPVYNYSDRIYSIKTKPKNITSTTEKSVTIDELEEPKVNENKTDAIVLEIKDSDIVPAESILQDRISNDNLSTYEDVTESDELVTEKYEAEEATVTTEIDVETTRAPLPRFLPKLSHFGKSTYGSFSQNLIAHPGKRRFRSRCRCEKIWNCVKLQISVGRCPEEYFLCCS